MKKKLCLLLAVMMVFGLAACNTKVQNVKTEEGYIIWYRTPLFWINLFDISQSRIYASSNFMYSQETKYHSFCIS